MKSIVAAFLIVVLGTTALFGAYPKKAEAVVSVAACITAPLKIFTQRAIAVEEAVGAASVSVLTTDPVGADKTAQSGAATESDDFKEQCFDAIFFLIAKLVINYMTASIVEWINSGFEGSPSFIDNPGQFFTDIVNNEFIDFMKEVFPNTAGALDFLCSPNLEFDLQLKFILKYGYKSSVRKKAACTVTDVIDNVNGLKVSVDEFLDGNFSGGGGWDRWFEVTNNPQNNGFGAELVLESEFLKRTAAALGLEQQVASWGNGFHSIIASTTEGINKIIMPGQAIENVLADTMGSGIRQLELADEFNEIVGALIGQLINKVIQGGLGALSGGSSSGPSFADQLSATYDDACANIQNSSSTSQETTDRQQACRERALQDSTTGSTTDPFANFDNGSGSSTISTSTFGNNEDRNIALNANVVMSSYAGGNSRGGAAVDGQVNGGTGEFENAVTSDNGWFGSPYNQWIQLDLKEVFDIGKINIWPRPATPRALGSRFIILISENQIDITRPLSYYVDINTGASLIDGITSIVVNEDISNDRMTPPFVLDNMNVKGRYVRLQRADGASRARINIQEIEIYQVPEPEEEDEEGAGSNSTGGAGNTTTGQ